MVINPDRLQEVAMGDDDFMIELIDLYLADAPGQLEALSQAVAREDASAVSAAAHKLKGSCGNVGAEGLVALCQQIEATGRASRLHELPELMEQATREFAEVNQALQGVKGGSPLAARETEPR